MKNFRKVLAVVLAFVLTATLSIAGTVAYLTDTDKEDNTFTIGNVQIDLLEKQRGENGLEDFENDKVLLPIVGSAQGEKDENGMPTAANYVDKMVTVKNTGESKAYIRVFVAIPHDLDDGADTYNAAANALHFNLGSKEVDGSWVTTNKVDWSWGTTAEGTDWNAYETDIEVDLPDDGENNTAKTKIKYTVYVGTYLHEVDSNEETTRAIDGFYLDSAVDCTVDEDGVFTWTKGEDVIYYELEKGVVIPVFAQAVQSAGFADAYSAFAAADMPANPFA